MAVVRCASLQARNERMCMRATKLLIGLLLSLTGHRHEGAAVTGRRSQPANASDSADGASRPVASARADRIGEKIASQQLPIQRQQMEPTPARRRRSVLCSAGRAEAATTRRWRWRCRRDRCARWSSLCWRVVRRHVSTSWSGRRCVDQLSLLHCTRVAVSIRQTDGLTAGRVGCKGWLISRERLPRHSSLSDSHRDDAHEQTHSSGREWRRTIRTRTVQWTC